MMVENGSVAEVAHESLFKTIGCYMAKVKVTQVTAEDGKKNTSLRLGSKTLKALKIKAIEEETSVQKILEKLVEGYLQGDIKIKL